MPSIILAVSLLVLSQSGVFIRFAQADAAAIGFWRMVIALPVLYFILGWQGKLRELRSLTSRQWLMLFLCGFFLFTHFWTWFLSVQKTTLANSMLLFALNPISTSLGAWIFFGERLARRHFLAMAFCFLGVFCLVKNSLHLDPGHLVGDGYGLVCAVLFSAYVLVGKGLRRALPNVTFTATAYSFCALCFLFVMIARDQPFLGYSSQTWGAFSALAFGSTLLGHALFTYSLQHFNVNLMSILTLTEPLFTAISAYLLFGEALTLGLGLGFLSVAVGVVVLYLPVLPLFGKAGNRA